MLALSLPAALCLHPGNLTEALYTRYIHSLIACTHACMHTYTAMHRHIYVYIQMYMCTCVYLHTYISNIYKI